jgi:hypothetical protein
MFYLENLIVNLMTPNLRNSVHKQRIKSIFKILHSCQYQLLSCDIAASEPRRSAGSSIISLNS